MKILVTEKIHEAGLQFMADKGFDVIRRFGITPRELVEEIKDVDGLLVRTRIKITRDILAPAAHLKVIGMHGVGLDHIDLEAAHKQGIQVLNVPGGNVNSVAELTLGLLIAVSRKLCLANQDVRQGGWHTNNFIGHQLSGQVIGILGLGKIGSKVAEICAAIGMKVLAYDPYCLAQTAEQLQVKLLPLEELLAVADVISIHLPLTDQTRHLLDDRLIQKMKPGVIIINAARGGILAEDAAYRGLKAGKIGGLGLDVTEQEPPGPEFKLLEFANVVTVPHIGARTQEAQVFVAKEIAKKMCAYLAQSKRGGSK